MSVDKLVQLFLTSVEEHYKNKFQPEDSYEPVHPSAFTFVRTAGELVGPCKARASHHREREKQWMVKMEEAEKELREKGVSVEATNPEYGQCLVSGSLMSPQGQLQAKIDNKLLEAVKVAKNKVMEHRDKAVGYEKYARAFAQAPDKDIKLSVSDADYFGLEA